MPSTDDGSLARLAGRRPFLAADRDASAQVAMPQGKIQGERGDAPSPCHGVGGVMAWMTGLLGGVAIASSSVDAGVLRHALVVGANDGGGGLERLRYAEADAGRIVDVLTELGGFDADAVTVLASPDRDQLDAALRRHADLARSSSQDLFFFYYSGHADARGLRLGEELVPYRDLKQQIRDLRSEVGSGCLTPAALARSPASRGSRSPRHSLPRTSSLPRAKHG